MVMNQGVKIHCKSVTTQVFSVLVLLVELAAAIEKPKGFIEASLSIR